MVRWCERYAPEVLAGLNPGATDAAIADAEAHLGVTFPEDLRDLYRLHDGQKGGRSGVSPLPVTEWLPLTEICSQWDVWEELRRGGTFDGIKSEPDERIRNDWWSASWIPLTHDGGGNHYCADLAPTDAGTVEQIIAMWHDDASRIRIAASVTQWLEQIVSGMESGEIVYSVKEYGAVVNKSDTDEDEEWRGVGDGS